MLSLSAPPYIFHLASVKVPGKFWFFELRLVFITKHNSKSIQGKWEKIFRELFFFPTNTNRSRFPPLSFFNVWPPSIGLSLQNDSNFHNFSDHQPRPSDLTMDQKSTWAFSRQHIIVARVFLEFGIDTNEKRNSHINYYALRFVFLNNSKFHS